MQSFPTDVDLCRRIGHGVERVAEQLLAVLHHFRLGFNPQDVLGWVIIKAAPLPSVTVKNDRPLVLARNAVQAVFAGGELLAVYGDIGCRYELSRLIGARPP